MEGPARPRRYCSWLLRCWELQGQISGGPVAWRYGLEDPHSGARRGFASFEALLAHLRAELGLDAAEPAQAAPGPGSADDAAGE